MKFLIATSSILYGIASILYVIVYIILALILCMIYTLLITFMIMMELSGSSISDKTLFILTAILIVFFLAFAFRSIII